MAERLIASIAEVDDQRAPGGTHFVLTYSDGGTEQRDGSLAEASELARNSGLCLVHTLNKSILWMRVPDTAWSA
jgi:hypothetical protein